MKKLSILLITVTIIMLSACSNCRNFDCPVNSSLEFEIVDRNGNNILRLPTQKYSSDSLFIISITETEIGFPELVVYKKSSIEIFLAFDQKEFIINYGISEADTIIISNIEIRKDECCGAFMTKFNSSINGKELCTDCFDLISIEK
ncbi:hypothetical protein R9C00_16325 [Flammeovirgaceae bacterium SG7u.111]|nr:hypothetical protein [Flammeovirgaceae bacterium SG7u.132]WPO33270.1 hypothetical protein R9C00_16325 [Flammeovirgaceae bacterium SG7u.111]